MDRITFILIALLVWIVTIILVIVVLNVINNKEKKKLKAEIEKLEKEKNMIISASMLSELNKVEALVNNDEMKEKLDDWKARFNDIKDKDIYYSLEGYLYPDTYIFEDKNVDVKTIFEKMLDKMDAVLTPYKDEIKKSDYSVHEILSLASVVELEAKNEEDRAGVADVFINRLNKKMALQSDVTTYYALKIDMSERDLTANELATQNPYNTRSTTMNGKIPVGPICMVSESSIKAILEHDDTDNLFFVADKNGKVYFSKTNTEHEKKIKELKDSGLWFTY